MRNISTFVNVRICCASKKLQTPFYHPGTKVWDVDRTPEVTPDTPGGRPEQGGPGHLQHGGLTCFFYWSTPMQRGVINWVFFLLAGVTIHGGPSSQRGTRKHLWKLYHPEGSVVTGVTGWDPRSGRQPGVEKPQCWQRWARLAAAAGLRLQLCTLTQDGQTPAEVRNGFHREQLYSKVMCHTCPRLSLFELKKVWIPLQVCIRPQSCSLPGITATQAHPSQSEDAAGLRLRPRGSEDLSAVSAGVDSQ